jgi:putative acetyltransferase
MTTIRAEQPGDRGAIDVVHLASFPSSAEATLVARMRVLGDLSVSLVADEARAVVGHVAFSEVSLQGSSGRGAGLAPVAVLASHRRRGVAAKLIEAGLAACRDAGFGFAVVLGDPAYYGRFGFAAARTRGLSDTYGGGDAFQVLELSTGALPAHGGVVRYGAVFDELPAEPPEGSDPAAMILALGPDGELGKEGRVPWNLPEDRAFFARTTRGHAVIMGRRTWDERGEPLPDRMNVVVSRSVAGLDGATVVRTLPDALLVARRAGAFPFVIGGARLYEEAVGVVSRVYLTDVPAVPDGADVFFQLDRACLREIASWAGERGERYRILERRA